MSSASTQILRVLGLLSLTVSSAAAEPCMVREGHFVKGRTSQHWSSTDDEGRDRSTTVRWRQGDCELRLDARGEFTIRPDLTGFISVDRDGYVELEERDGDHNRKVRVTGSGGSLEYRWSLDGKSGFDVDRDQWLSQILMAVERRTAMFAKSRVPALVRQGGANAVLDETNLLESDYARKVYFNLLLSSIKLTDQQTERMLDQTGESMSSDYERGEVLRAIAKQGPMSDRVTRAAIAVAARMTSDYEKRRALSAGLESVGSPASRSALFTAASTIGSNYELAELLIAAQKRSLVDSLSGDAYFKAVAKLNSDYERRRTLSALLKARPDSPTILGGVLDASTSIHSDYELATLLVEFAKTVAVRGDIRERYLKATRSIQSDYEYRRALQALLEQDRRS